MSKQSLREKILSSNDIEEELVDVPQWGVKLLIRAMNGKERAAMLRDSVTEDGEIDFDHLYPLMLIATVRDPEDGSLVFTRADIDAINTKSGGALERVAQVASRLSGLDKDEVNKLGKPSSPAMNASTESDASPST